VPKSELGLTDNGGPEKGGPKKNNSWKMQDLRGRTTDLRRSAGGKWRTTAVEW